VGGRRVDGATRGQWLTSLISKCVFPSRQLAWDIVREVAGNGPPVREALTKGKRGDERATSHMTKKTERRKKGRGECHPLSKILKGDENPRETGETILRTGMHEKVGGRKRQQKRYLVVGDSEEVYQLLLYVLASDREQDSVKKSGKGRKDNR